MTSTIDPRRFTGTVHLLEIRGVSVVSDIDDTSGGFAGARENFTGANLASVNHAPPTVWRRRIQQGWKKRHSSTTSLPARDSSIPKTRGWWIVPASLADGLGDLRTHGLIKKIGRTYKYYMTKLGQPAIVAATKLRETLLVPTFRKTTAA